MWRFSSPHSRVVALSVYSSTYLSKFFEKLSVVT